MTPSQCGADFSQQRARVLKLVADVEIRDLAVLVSRLRDRDAADEAFSEFTLDLVRGLPGFRWECSARIWAYRLARHAMWRCARRRFARQRQEAPLPEAGALLELAEQIRTRTVTIARTGTKQYFARLCQRLSEDDQTLLLLRVNRQLDWQDIARVLGEPATLVEPEQLAKESARLRKRFQLIKERLRKLAASEGMLPSV